MKMDFNKRLLSVAISSILLSACGGSGGSSSSGDEDVVVPPAGPEVTTPDPVLPPPLPVNPTLTSEQKLALGQAYVPTLLGNLKSISQGADAFMLSSGNAEASILSAGAEIFEPISMLAEHIYATRKQQLKGEIELDVVLPLSIEVGNYYYWAIEGSYEVSSSGDDQIILSYDVDFQLIRKESGVKVGAERKLNFDISISDGETSEYPRGNWLHQVTLDGYLDIVDERQITVQGLELKTIVDIGDEAKLLAVEGDHYRGTEFYQIDLTAEQLTIVTSGIKTSGGLELVGVMPQNLSQYSYGSLSVGDRHASAYRAYGIDFIKDAYQLLPLVSEKYSYPNIENFRIRNLISERIEDSKLLIQHDLTELTDANPDTFSTAYGGDIKSQKVADYIVSEDEQSITFNNSWSAMSLILGDESESESNIKCEAVDISYLLPQEGNLVFINPYGCVNGPIVLDEKYETIESWLLKNEFSLYSYSSGHVYPFVMRDGTPKYVEITASGEVIGDETHIINDGIDEVGNPWLFDFTSQGKAPDSNGNFLNYDISWSHQGLFDYAGSVTIDLLGEFIELDLAHKDGAVAIHGTVDIDRQTIDVEGTSQVELNIDVTNLVQQVLNNKVDSYINESIGNIKLDGENIAQLNVISGNFSSNASAENHTLSLPNPLLCNALMPFMEKFCLDMEPQSFALSIQYSDGTALTEIDGLIDNVENLVYEESCPEDQVIEGGCNVELEKTFHSVSGVIKASELFDALK
jgi:hypothetical protein